MRLGVVLTGLIRSEFVTKLLPVRHTQLLLLVMLLTLDSANRVSSPQMMFV